MDNLKALRGLCNAICNTFYPDRAAMEMMLFNEGIESDAEASPKDEKLFRVAIRLVRGYVESSRAECGVSTSVRGDGVNAIIMRGCMDCGLDGEGYLISVKTIEDGSNLW